MTAEQITKWAREAGFSIRGDVIRTMHSSGAWVGINEELQAFAKLVRNATLEEAAKACEKECDNWDEERPLLFAAKEIRSMKS